MALHSPCHVKNDQIVKSLRLKTLVWTLGFHNLIAQTTCSSLPLCLHLDFFFLIRSLCVLQVILSNRRVYIVLSIMPHMQDLAPKGLNFLNIEKRCFQNNNQMFWVRKQGVMSGWTSLVCCDVRAAKRTWPQPPPEGGQPWLAAPQFGFCKGGGEASCHAAYWV